MAAHTRTDPADVLDRVGRHWGWLLGFGIMEIASAFRIRSLRA